MGNFYVPRADHIPACFPTPELFGRWREMARSCSSGIGQDAYCADCTPTYKACMMLAGKCGFPHTTFEIDEDGFIKGRRRVLPISPLKHRERDTVPDAFVVVG